MRSPGPAFSVTAVGGYGRGTLAPGSDIDLLFLLPVKKPSGPSLPSSSCSISCGTWASRSAMPRARSKNASAVARRHDDPHGDPRNALHLRLEGAGKRTGTRFDKRNRQGTGPEFIAAKLAERDERHRKAGDTRYLVEPNVKEGKGGLRDCTRCSGSPNIIYRVRDTAELSLGVSVDARNTGSFQKADDFLWAVRCHMHFLTGKAEERLSFDIQREIAESLGYHAHPA
jgi:[protein-PII] uridylyltransferase